jgi:hypothetical protein
MQQVILYLFQCGLPDTSSEISWLNKIVEEARKIRK